MSAAAVPFHLRPHKSVDRRLFVDLLARYERWRPIRNYAYVSMGAYALEDHKMIHRRFGISRLIAFDRDENTVARQRFNRPVGSCRCLNLGSGEIIARLREVLDEETEEEVEGVVIWLDYTAPGELGTQIREFQDLLSALLAGDVVRITVNAEATALAKSMRSDGKQLEGDDLLEERFEELKRRIGDYLPTDASAKDVRKMRLPKLLGRAFGQAASKAEMPLGGKKLSPLSIVSYADGQRMLSITGALVEREDEEKMRSKIDLESWPFKSAGWSCMRLLNVPDLTVRERMFLERRIDAAEDEITDGLGFEFGGDIDVMEFVQQYRRYYRFYPSLVALDV